MTDTDRLVENFFTTSKFPHGPLAEIFLGRCQSHTVKAAGRFYKYFRQGTGPVVLLVHGVHSNLATMVDVARALLDEGFQVVLFDAPAHGEARGTTTDPAEVRALITAVAGRFAELHAVVGHSLGGLWSVTAWDAGVRPKVFVSVSSPARMRWLVDTFAASNRLDDDRVRELERGIEDRLGRCVWEDFSPSAAARSIDVPALILHGTDDELVPVSHASDLHAAWDGSTCELVDGAGHFDILKRPEVRKRIARFVADAAGESPAAAGPPADDTITADPTGSPRE